MKKILTIVGIVIVLLGIWWLLSADTPSQQVACTTDAFVCPDGSSVGRTGPDCAFAACPAPSDNLIRLYYYDAARDVDAQGNVLCSERGLVPIVTPIPNEERQTNQVIRALLSGEIVEEAKQLGLTSEFPLEGLVYLGSARALDKLILTFDDPNHVTSGGSCRMSVLRAQIEATARQFTGINEVIIKPDDLFQP